MSYASPRVNQAIKRAFRFTQALLIFVLVAECAILSVVIADNPRKPTSLLDSVELYLASVVLSTMALSLAFSETRGAIKKCHGLTGSVCTSMVFGAAVPFGNIDYQQAEMLPIVRAILSVLRIVFYLESAILAFHILGS